MISVYNKKRIVRVRTTVVSDSKIRECVMTMTSFALFLRIRQNTLTWCSDNALKNKIMHYRYKSKRERKIWVSTL